MGCFFFVAVLVLVLFVGSGVSLAAVEPVTGDGVVGAAAASSDESDDAVVARGALPDAAAAKVLLFFEPGGLPLRLGVVADVAVAVVFDVDDEVLLFFLALVGSSGEETASEAGPLE